jgi:hypothetical protein
MRLPKYQPRNILVPRHTHFGSRCLPVRYHPVLYLPFAPKPLNSLISSITFMDQKTFVLETLSYAAKPILTLYYHQQADIITCYIGY